MPDYLKHLSSTIQEINTIMLQSCNHRRINRILRQLWNYVIGDLTKIVWFNFHI